METKIKNCCQILAVHPTETSVIFACGRDPDNGIECEFRPMANVEGDWCDNSVIVEFRGTECLACVSTRARLVVLDKFIRKVQAFKRNMLQ